MLNSPLAEELYSGIEHLPLIDWHNHLAVADLKNDRKFSNITELWLKSDPYKHRAMRICGVPEKFITGNSSDYEKFEAWFRTLPQLAGNPLFFWSALELERIFGISGDWNVLSPRKLYDQLGEMLADERFSARSLLKHFQVEYAAPCAAAGDDLTAFDGMESIVPSLRGDDICNLEYAPFRECDSLEEAEELLAGTVASFHSHGCRFADHALDCDFEYLRDDGKNAERFMLWKKGVLPEAEKNALQCRVLRCLGREYARNDWILQLHIGALRKTSGRLRAAAGAAGGYAGIGSGCNMTSLATLLDDLERSVAGMPRVILYTLNPAAHAPFAVLSGSFTGNGVRGNVSLGPAWWYCDHVYGIRDCLENVAAYGVLSVFPGMTTDSRSILSFVRHEYFRRIFCSFLAEKSRKDELPDDIGILRMLAENAAYNNAAEMIKE